MESAKAALNVARANLTTPDIRSIQASGIRKQIAQQQSQISSALAEEARQRAQLTEVTANRDDLTVVAPFDGTVVTRTAEPGEVIQAGTAIVTLLDMNRVYLRGFVPEGQIGKVKVGQRARLFLDSNSKQPLDAEVQRIDPQATFTPENTYFRDDRVKQVVGVKLLVKSGIGFAKPGMPADGDILVSGDTWPPMFAAANQVTALPPGRAGSRFVPSPKSRFMSAGLWKRYGAVEAVRGIDLEVRKGEIYGLIGPDGAGEDHYVSDSCRGDERDVGRRPIFLERRRWMRVSTPGT